MYTIRNFDPSYVEDQVKLDQLVTGHYDFPNPTSVESQEKIYENLEFEPESKKYLFHSDTMVGFMTAQISVDEQSGNKTAAIRLPIVDQEHQEATSLLLEAMRKYLLQQDIDHITCVAYDHIIDNSLLSSYTLDKAEELFSMGLLEVNSSSLQPPQFSPVRFSYADYEQLETIITAKMKLPEPTARALFKNLIATLDQKGEEKFSLQLIKQDSKIIGFSGLSISNRWEDRGRMVPVWIDSDLAPKDQVQVVHDLFHAHFNLMRPRGLQYIELYLPPYLKRLEPFYSSLGFEFHPFYKYNVDFVRIEKWQRLI